MKEKEDLTEQVTIFRGGTEVTLFKSPNLIAVRMCDGCVLENLTGRLATDLQLPTTLRFIKRYPGKRIGIFFTDREERDSVMDKLRTRKTEVQYCSHVFTRSEKDNIPGEEIGLDNKVFIEYKKEPDRKFIKEIEKEHNLRAIWHFPEKPTACIFELTDSAKVNPIKVSRELVKSKKIKAAEPCLIEAKIGRAIPNDVGFRSQWHLMNIGQGGGVPGADCNASEAWDYTWGDPAIKVAIIDDGFDLSHPDFYIPGKIVAPYDATQHDTNPLPSGFSENHGTSCAGVALAARGSGIAIGVAPDCSFIPIRHAGRLGDYDEALAFYHAFKNGADVISCSWGPPDAYQNKLWPLPGLTRHVIDICVEKGRNGKGIPIFFAAGNGNELLDLDGYADYEGVIAVAACTNEDKKAWYSDYGKNVWVTAPSNGGTLGIFTTDRTGPDGYSWDSDYTSSFGGTSAAAPLVAGVAALILSANPELKLDQVKEILKKTAVKINKDNSLEYEDTWGKKYTDAYNKSGHSDVYGWGRVDAGAAVREALEIAKS